MSKIIIVIFSLILGQYTFAQCIGSRIDELASIPNIPPEYLALGNYGAMDFLSSPILEPFRRNILFTSTFPVASIPEVTCENIFASAYSVDALNYKVPYSINTIPASFEATYAINKPYFLTESPITNLRPLSNEFAIISNYLRSSPYEFNSLAFEAPYGLSATAALPYVSDILQDTSVLVNPFNRENVCVSNIPNYVNPSIYTPSSTCAAQTIATDVFSAPSALSEVLSRIFSFTPNTNIKCLDGIGPASLAASRGGGLLVTSSSPSRPIGISISSENTFQGSLSVAGKLPFLGTVSLGDTLPSFGYGTVNYNCGSGNVAMLSENPPNMPNSWYPRL